VRDEVEVLGSLKKFKLPSRIFFLQGSKITCEDPPPMTLFFLKPYSNVNFHVKS
jgi:hypothetical protein